MLRLFTRAPQVSDPRTVELQLADGTLVEVSMRRHPRARRIKLSVDERGARLTLPTRASERAALDFLHAHRDWLQAQWRMLHAELPTPLAPVTSTALPLRGASHPLAWQAGRLTRVQPIEGGYRFDVRGLQEGMATTPAMHRALRDFYEAEARADIARWLPKYAAGLTKPPSRVVLKRMSSQWGSLSPSGVVALDLSLVLARPSAFEYVLVHELCHLIHHDHSRAFWREVEARWPTWREERDYLHAEGRRLKSTLRSLTD